MMLYSNKFKSSLFLQISLIVTGNFCFLEHFICAVYFLESVIN